MKHFLAQWFNVVPRVLLLSLRAFAMAFSLNPLSPRSTALLVGFSRRARRPARDLAEFCVGLLVFVALMAGQSLALGLAVCSLALLFGFPAIFTSLFEPAERPVAIFFAAFSFFMGLAFLWRARREALRDSVSVFERVISFEMICAEGSLVAQTFTATRSFLNHQGMSGFPFAKLFLRALPGLFLAAFRLQGFFGAILLLFVAHYVQLARAKTAALAQLSPKAGFGALKSRLASVADDLVAEGGDAMARREREQLDAVARSAARRVGGAAAEERPNRRL
jgi:hypothetical protein